MTDEEFLTKLRKSILASFDVNEEELDSAVRRLRQKIFPVADAYRDTYLVLSKLKESEILKDAKFHDAVGGLRDKFFTVNSFLSENKTTSHLPGVFEERLDALFEEYKLYVKITRTKDRRGKQRDNRDIDTRDRVIRRLFRYLRLFMRTDEETYHIIFSIISHLEGGINIKVSSIRKAVKHGYELIKNESTNTDGVSFSPNSFPLLRQFVDLQF